jgi:hypothetical protein
MADFVVTGTGRCGTAHCWRVLTHIGVPAAHERFFELDRRSFDENDRLAYDAFPTNDVALMAAPFLSQVGKPSIHLVRDPVETVNSFLHLRLPMTASHEVTDFINHWMKIEGTTNEEQWADYWEKWNRMCAEHATYTVQVESLSRGDVSDVFLAPIIGAGGFVQAWQQLGITTNRVHEVTANLVPPHVADRLRRSGEEFGYYV